MPPYRHSLPVQRLQQVDGDQRVRASHACGSLHRQLQSTRAEARQLNANMSGYCRVRRRVQSSTTVRPVPTDNT